MNTPGRSLLKLDSGMGAQMNDSDLRGNDLDVALQEAGQDRSDCETSLNPVINQTEAARMDDHQPTEGLRALRQRLDAKEEQLRALQRELRLRDERIAQLERLYERESDTFSGARNEPVVAMGLVLESLHESGVVHRISRITTAIGRGGSNDIVLDTGSVSRYHARIVVASDSVYLIDLQSTNGCAVNGERISRQMINNGDVVAIGDAKFKFATGVPLSEVEDRWMDETQALLDESIVFTRVPPKADAESKQMAEDATKTS